MFRLMRFHKPVGILLLLWPVLWALWLASNGFPPFSDLFLFVTGVVLMRAAGCIVNDIADRKWDGKVERTKDRPLVQNDVTLRDAWILFFGLIVTAFVLLLFLGHLLTLLLSFPALIIAVVYPFLKRVTDWPQLGLGAAFSIGVLMAFAQVQLKLSFPAFYVFFTALVWPLIYDTWYAMVDCDDDVNIGIRSTAVRFRNSWFMFISIFSAVFIILLIGMKWVFSLNHYYDSALFLVFFHAVYSLYQLKKNARRELYFSVFKQHQWIGCIIFLGIVLGQSS